MQGKCIKILYVNGGIMDCGGVSSVMMNYYSHMNSDIVKIDFLVHGFREGVHDYEIFQRGSKIYRVVPKSKNPIKNYKQIKGIIKNGNYDIVHSHADSGNAYILKIAKECGVKIRISHSHNTNYTISSKLRIFLNEMQKKNISKYSTDLWACSKMAAKWLYGTSDNVLIVNNAIDSNKYKYDEKHRTLIRKKYGWGDRFIIGMVGRLSYQKNQVYAMDIIYEIKKSIPNVLLFLCGEGELKAELVLKSQEKKLENEIYFAGKIDNMNEFYSVFDVFIMPSNFEGLPVSAIEAQCNGLPCILSDNITREAKVTDNVIYLPIGLSNVKDWCKEIIIARRENISSLDFYKTGFDIDIEAEKIMKQYCLMLNIPMENN